MSNAFIFLTAFTGLFFIMLICGNLDEINHQQDQENLLLSDAKKSFDYNRLSE